MVPNAISANSRVRMSEIAMCLMLWVVRCRCSRAQRNRGIVDSEGTPGTRIVDSLPVLNSPARSLRWHARRERRGLEVAMANTGSCPTDRTIGRIRRGWVQVVGGLLLLLSLPACEIEEPDGNRVEFWGIGREGETVQALLPEFRRLHPDIPVVVQQIPWSAAHEKLLTAYVGGHLPDVFQLGNTWIPEFVAIGALDDLSDRFRDTLPAADFFPGILETNRLDGAIYGVPWYVDTRLLFYRTDLLEQVGIGQPPRDWVQWWAAMERIKVSSTAGRYAILLPVNEWQMPVILALQLGSSLLREDGRYGDFRGAPFRRAFLQYLQIFRNGWAPALHETQLGNLFQDFARGMLTFYVTGPWNLGEFRRRLPRELTSRWSTAPMPAPDARYPGVSIAGGASLVLNAHSGNKDAAWKLIEFLLEPTQQLAFYRLTGDLPSRKNPWEAGELAADPAARAFRTQLDRVLPLPKIPEWERIAAKVGQYSEKTIRAELDPEHALEALDHDVDAILEKRRWLLERKRR